MNRQVGALRFGEDGLARRGLLVRHLVMPGMLEQTQQILRFVAAELGRGTYVNLMAQYYPGSSAGTGAKAMPRSTGTWRAASTTAPPRSPANWGSGGSTNAAAHPACNCLTGPGGDGRPSALATTPGVAIGPAMRRRIPWS